LAVLSGRLNPAKVNFFVFFREFLAVLSGLFSGTFGGAFGTFFGTFLGDFLAVPIYQALQTEVSRAE
jgi:uncharacterized membrane protein